MSFLLCILCIKKEYFLYEYVELNIKEKYLKKQIWADTTPILML